MPKWRVYYITEGDIRRSVVVRAKDKVMAVQVARKVREDVYYIGLVAQIGE